MTITTHDDLSMPPIIIVDDLPPHGGAAPVDGPAAGGVGAGRAPAEEFHGRALPQWLILAGVAAYAATQFVANGRGPSLWFWALAGAAVLFHLLARRTPYLRLTADGFSFPEQDDREIAWSRVASATERERGIELRLAGGGRVEMDFAKVRYRDTARLRRAVFGRVARVRSAEAASLPVRD